MLDFVKEVFLEEKRRQEEEGTKCLVRVDGYTDFIFINRFGMLQHQSTLNKAIRRITRECNDAVLRKNPNAKVLLPHFSCHSLRHTFTTRMCEAGVNVKVIQDTLGHADISTTLNIYADVTKDLKKAEDIETSVGRSCLPAGVFLCLWILMCHLMCQQKWHIKPFHSLQMFQSCIETGENSKTALEILEFYWYDKFQ